MDIRCLHTLHHEVAKTMESYPHGMIHAQAEKALEKVREGDDSWVNFRWLLASYELSKPRVHGLTVQDNANATEALG